MDTRVHVGDFYDRILGAQSRLGDVNVLLVIVATVGGLFLVIESVALVMGFPWRSQSPGRCMPCSWARGGSARASLLTA